MKAEEREEGAVTLGLTSLVDLLQKKSPLYINFFSVYNCLIESPKSQGTGMVGSVQRVQLLCSQQNGRPQGGTPLRMWGVTPGGGGVCPGGRREAASRDKIAFDIATSRPATVP